MNDDLARALAGRKLLSPESENEFQRDLQFAPGWRDWRRGFERSFGVYPDTEPGGDYNYRLAWMSGARPEVEPSSGDFHGLSDAIVPPFQNPIQLKAGDHPTRWKGEFMNKFGVNPDLMPLEQYSPEMRAFLDEKTRRELLAHFLKGVK